MMTMLNTRKPTANSKSCKDHLGNVYPSVRAMCQHYGIPTSTFHNRMTHHSENYTLETALTLPPDNHRNAGSKCEDHEGNKFKSRKDMCKHWGISTAMYFGRIKLGWTVKDALTAPPDYKGGASHVFDHEGQEFTDIGEMCKAWNIKRTTYNQRIKAGWTVKKALTEPAKKINSMKPKVCMDHLGNVYASQNEMCRHYGVTRTLMTTRLKLGWTLKQIFENPEVINPEKPCTDHLGKTYPSLKDMLEAYGVCEQTYRGRLKRGCTLKQALSPQRISEKQCVDHKGNVFNSIKEMCRYWNIDKGLYWARLQRQNMDQKTALSTISPKTIIDDHLSVIKCLEGDYYAVSINKIQDVWTADEIFEYYRKINNIPTLMKG